MQKKKIKLYLILVFILFVFVLYFSLKDNFMDIVNALSKVNLLYLLLGIVFVFVSKYLIGIILFNLARGEKKDVLFKKIMHISFIYPFFAGITPGSLGGESFEIFYLKDTGISYGKSSNITIQKYILYEISLILVNFIVVILNLFTNIVPKTGLVTFVVTLNFVINIVFLSLLFLLAYNSRFNHFVVNKVLAFLYKIRIIKDLEKMQDKLDHYLDNFNDGVDKLKSNKKLFVKLIFISMLSLVFLLISAYPIARSLDINSISFLNLFILSTYTKMISWLIATPGNSGAAEYCFIYLFTGLIGYEDIMAYMLIWRFVTYYVPLTAGGILAMMWRKGENNEETYSIKS